jgi:4-diphosphocytidyl-2C-methyl-D-erythritol kinase
MQIEAFKKYPALEVVIENIKEKFRIPAMMSGSGSACFAIVNDLSDEQIVEMKSYIKSLLGETCFIADA